MGGSDFLAEQAACHSVATYSYLVGILGMKLRKKKREREQEEMCALMKIIHSLNRYVSYARPSSRFCCCCFVASVVSDSFVTPWTVAHQTPLSMGFPRQEYWRGFSFPPPGDLPDPETELKSPALAGGFFAAEPPGKHSPRIGDCQSSRSHGISILLGMVYTCVHTKST